jgi:hypothetical protein
MWGQFLLAYFPKVGLCDLHAVCVCVGVCVSPFNQLLSALNSIYETWYV